MPRWPAAEVEGEGISGVVALEAAATLAVVVLGAAPTLGVVVLEAARVLVVRRACHSGRAHRFDRRWLIGHP
jgi:hypothetical protein